LYVNQDDRKIAVGIFKEKGYIKDFECQMRRKDGSIFWARYDGQFTKTEDGTPCFQGFVIDITDRKEAEEEIKSLNVELEQRVIARTTQLEAANKELEAFSYSVSHDLRAPLRTIDGFSKALLEEYQEKLDDTGKSFLDRVRKATQRMGLLIDDMLKLSRITQAEIKRGAVDLSGMVREITEAHQKSNPDRAVDVTIQDGVMVQGDQYLIKIAMENLVGNAFKFTGKEAHPRIEFGAVNKDGETCYFIGDNGAGFDMTYVGKLFGAFHRLHASDEFPGTGVGLATVQRIIHRHGGQVWAEGEVGKGATFYFTLPS
jgi:light-regulated signal transduction histidine kinase (bacteriophytochrome)